MKLPGILLPPPMKHLCVTINTQPWIPHDASRATFNGELDTTLIIRDMNLLFKMNILSRMISARAFGAQSRLASRQKYAHLSPLFLLTVTRRRTA